MRKILFIAHYFPPLGGGGVQRSSKFVKHLPGHGILPIVLTGDHQVNDFWSPPDSSLIDDVSSEVPIYRASWDPQDSRRDGSKSSGGQRCRALYEAGELAIREHQPELIYVSMAPYGDAYLAARLAEKYRLPWVADLRDPWALDEFEVYRTRWHRMGRRREMQSALQAASLIVMNTPEAAARFRASFPRLARSRVVSLTNGFDAGDFLGAPPARDSSKFTIVHSGHLHSQGGLRQEAHSWLYRVLGRTEPGVKCLSRSHYYLLQAIDLWCREDPTIREDVRLVLVGAHSKSDRDLIAQAEVREMVQATGYLPHRESVGWIRRADLLFLPMHTLPPGRRATIVPGKAYEYMATGRPILAAVPSGDARDFIERAGTGLVCDPSDVGAMRRHLQSQYGAWRAGTETRNWNRSFVDQFERGKLAGHLAEQIHGLLASISATKDQPCALSDAGLRRPEKGQPNGHPAPSRCPVRGSMTVSAIIPTYNRAGTIGRAVESVLAQTVKPQEVIVVDDGSTDDTTAVLERFGDQVRVLRQPNQGASAARNAGIRVAQGDIIAFLDSDDYWLPTKNERQLELLHRYAAQGVTCCICNARLDYADGTSQYSFDMARLRPKADSGLWINPATILATRFLLFNQVAAVRRDALERAGLFDESLRIMEDYDLQLRLAVTGPWAYLREPLVAWQGGSPHSLTSAATEHQARLYAYSILQSFGGTPNLQRWVAPDVLAHRLWHLRSMIAAEEMAHRSDWLSRVQGRMWRRALRLWQSVCSRLPGYPQMITPAC